MAETPKIDKAEKAAKKVSLRAVFGGPMRNPMTEDLFTSEASKPVELDAWLNTQIEAGKIEIVE